MKDYKNEFIVSLITREKNWNRIGVELKLWK